MTAESTTQSPYVSPSDDHAEHGSTKLYLSVFLALCALTTLSFLTYFPFWRERVPTEISRTFMMAVSCCKALLVILFFMHLKWEASWKWVLTIPASLMSIFLMLALVPDVGLRMRHASHDRMKHAAEVPMEEHSEQGAHKQGAHRHGVHEHGTHEHGAHSDKTDSAH